MHMYFSPLFPYFSGLVLRTAFYIGGIYSRSRNLQAYTLSGNFCLKDIPTECQEAVTAGGWRGKSKVVMH